MAEEMTDDLAGDHPEPPARSANRRELYVQRIAAARNAKEVLRAVAGYLQATFARHNFTDAKLIAERLMNAIDEERRRHCGPRDDA